jgi:hypothetical protein
MYFTAAGFLMAYYFVNVAGFHQAIKKLLGVHPQERFRPFDCVVCLSVWLAVVLYFLPVEVSQFITFVFAAGFISTRVK